MPQTHPPPQEYARVFLIFIFLFYLYTSPDQGPPPGFASPRDYAGERVARQRRALSVLNMTKWGDFEPRDNGRWELGKALNLTGFRSDDGFGWDRLEAWRARCEKFGADVHADTKDWKGGKGGELGGEGLSGKIYENVTGIVQGRWVRFDGDIEGPEKRMKRRFNLSEITPGIDWAYRDEEFWTGNVTGAEGKLMLRVDERGREEMDFNEDSMENPPTSPGDIGLVRDVAATITVQDESSSGDGWDMRVHGVHWPRQGAMLLTTTSEKFAGIFALPHLTPSSEHYAGSQKLLNMTLQKTIDRLQKSIWVDSSNPWSSSPESPNDSIMPIPHCEYIIFVQIHPINTAFLSNLEGFPINVQKGHPTNIIHQFEEELRFPNGAPISDVPRLQMSVVIFSPDCGFMLESKGPPTYAPEEGEHLVGMKQEIFLHSVQNWLLVLAAVILGQVLLLKMQMKEASTPSTIGRISLFTAGTMVMADGLLFTSFSLLSATAPNIFPSALLASFAALLSVGLGVRFIGELYKVQEPERRERQRLQAASETANAPSGPTPRTVASVITAGGADIPPTTFTSTVTTNTPIIIPSDQDITAEIVQAAQANAATPRLPTTNPTTAIQPPSRGMSDFAAIYGQFVLVLAFILFLSLSSISWPIPLRTAYTHLLSILYFSLWLPQIHRNIIRNCRKALLWKYIVGQSILRLLPFAYFYLKEDNVLFAESDWKAFTALVGWVWIQIWVLVAQEVLGPRWGIPKGWTEEGWDYHPILREDNLEAGGLPIGLVQIPGSPGLDRTRTSSEEPTRKKRDGGTRSVDCAICMQVLEVPVVAAGEDISGSGAAGGVTGMLARRQYMVTPCRHVFHSACLEGWMRFRLQCPICRENLPPL